LWATSAYTHEASVEDLVMSHSVVSHLLVGRAVNIDETLVVDDTVLVVENAV